MSEQALTRLGEAVAEAVTGVLERFAAGRVSEPEVSADAGDQSPLEGLGLPAVAASVSYVDGVNGGNVLVMTLEAARRLAAAMMGLESPEEPQAAELSELELSAVSEAMNEMMASAAGATSAVIGSEVEISPPETRTFTSAAEAVDAFPSTPHAITTTFSVCGEPCRLVQLIPNAFVVRLATALDELDAAQGAGVAGRAGYPSLSGIPVRVWAELGRTRMPSAQVVGLPPGAVVELDSLADDAIDLYVNGRCFATGRLVVVDGGDWAVRIEHVLDGGRASTEPRADAARWPESW